MTKQPLVILCLGLMACTSSPTTGAKSPSPSPNATPTVASDLPVTRVGFACRLPVVTSKSQGIAGANFQGGFITFPAARLEQDPTGTILSGTDDVATAATPVLHGNGFVPFYDRAASRWVPAPASQALADGSAYAYTTWKSQTGIFTAHVVDVASGDSRSFDLALTQWDPYVADFRAEGVYLASGSGLGGPGQGAWLLDPLTGAVKNLRQVNEVWTVRNGYAWAAAFDPRDKTPWGPSELAPANSMLRIDLATGAQTIWFYQAGTYPWFLGLDSYDRPVVLLGHGNFANEIRLIDRPGSSGVMLFSGNTDGLGYLQGDADRLWFGNTRGIYLYRPGRPLQKVFAYDANPASSDRIEPAGFCV